MQNSTTETQAKRNHQFDLHGSTTLTDSNKLQPPKLIQKPTTNSATHADSTHLWNPATDSTSILELKPNQHTSETQPIQTTFETHADSSHWFNPPLKPTPIQATDSTHLWNPVDSNHHFKPNKHRFNPTKNNRVKRKKK